MGTDALRRDREDLAARIRACQRCPDMLVKGKAQASPGYGSVRSPVMIVGQSLCGPCVQKQEPFYKGCGTILDDAFAAADVDKRDLFVTNVVHCHPPKNRASKPEEIANCAEYLSEELDMVGPRLVIGLGGDARTVLTERYPATEPLQWPFVEPPYDGGEGPALLFPPHPGWFRWKPKEVRGGLIAAYVADLAAAIRWAVA